MSKFISYCVALCALPFLAFSWSAQAASPQLTRIVPRGGQRGTEVVLSFDGQRLADAQEVLMYEPGLQVIRIAQPTDKKLVGKQVKVTVKIAPDARVGEYQMRLRTATGVSELKTFWVGTMPIVAEKEPNSDFKTPQAIPLNVTVAGVIESEDQDYFVIDAKKGQRITAEIEAMRLGEAPLDPYLAILDEKRFELTSDDDSSLLRQDSVVSIVAPKDGKYTLELRDSAYGGSGSSFYRLHVGTFPRPRVVYPPGGQVGQTVEVSYIGDVKGTIKQTIKLPDHPVENFELFATQDGQTSPSPNHFRVSDFPSVNEVEPNDNAKTATTYAGELPVGFNGVISKPAGQSAQSEKKEDADYFKFHAKKGQALNVHVYARQLRSPLDSVLSIHDAKGRQLAANDDSGGPDSFLKFNVPADGEYCVRVVDHLHKSGDEYTYRVEITPVTPTLTLSIPQYTQQYSQERQAVTVPQGNLYATLVRVARQDVPGGPTTLSAKDLPAGVKMEAENLDAAVDAVPVIFEASADAKVSGKLVDVTAKPVKGEATGEFKQMVELVTNGNQQPFYTIAVDKMAVAVAEPAPFKLKIVEPKVPLVQGGQMNLKVVAERDKEFTGPINVKLLFKPPGVEAAANVEIAAGKNEAIYPINASDGAAVRKWKLVVVGEGDKDGKMWVSSPFTTVEVAPAFVTAKIENTKVEQGKSVNIAADLSVKSKWEGKAKVELVGLPGNATAPEKEITSSDTKIEFPVTTGKSTPIAQHKGLFLRVTIMQNGEPVVHNIGRGGILRVDGPLVAKSDAKGKSDAKAKPDTKTKTESKTVTPEAKTPAKAEAKKK
jgi:hypothetical protein